MKNIVIIGVARSGKPTLAKKIYKKYKNYQILSGDDLRNTFQEVFRQLKIKFHLE